MIFVRPYITKAYMVKHAHASELEKLSKGAYKKPHPVTTDTDKSDAKKEVPFLHQPAVQITRVNLCMIVKIWKEILDQKMLSSLKVHLTFQKNG